MFLFTFTVWLLKKFNYICGFHQILLGDTTLEVGKATSRHLPGGSPEKQPLEFPLNSAQPQPLKNVCFPDSAWVPETTQGGLTHFFLVPHISCSHPGGSDPSKDLSVATKPTAPSSRFWLLRTSTLCGNFPGVTFSLLAATREVASLSQALSQLQGILSPRQRVLRVRGWLHGARDYGLREIWMGIEITECLGKSPLLYI